MARKVFFSFHFNRDCWRAGQIRNSNLLSEEDRYGFVDGSEWEKIEKEGDEAIKRWINDQLRYTSVTVVLIGAETAERDWVDYEIRQSWSRGNALLGVFIHNVKDQNGKIDVSGPNPLNNIKLKDGKSLSDIFKTYDWVNNNGRENLGRWIEEAFRIKEADKNGGEISESAETAKTEAVFTNFNSGNDEKGFTPRSPWCDDNANIR